MIVARKRLYAEAEKLIGRSFEGQVTAEVLLALRNHSPEGCEIRRRYLDQEESERQADRDERIASAKFHF